MMKASSAWIAGWVVGESSMTTSPGQVMFYAYCMIEGPSVCCIAALELPRLRGRRDARGLPTAFLTPEPVRLRSVLARFLRAGVMGVLAAARRPCCMALYSEVWARLAGFAARELTCRTWFWLRRKEPTSPRC